MKNLLLIFAFLCLGTSLYAQTPRALYKAAAVGNIIQIEYLVSSDITKVDAIDENGWTALIYAVEFGQIGSLFKLIKLGADINYRDIAGKTPFIHAIEKGNIEIAKRLVQFGADVTLKDFSGESALMAAARNGRTGMIITLVKEYGFDINERDKSNRTALMHASWNGHEYTAAIIVKMGADVNAVDHDGWTALTRSVNFQQHKSVEILELLGVEQ